MKVLVTGGAGYIGSAVAAALEVAGHTPVILDSLVRGPRAFVGDRIFYQGDVADRSLIQRIVQEHPDLETTIHLAARTVVKESFALPAVYVEENLTKSRALVEELVRLDRSRIIFGSTAAVYGDTGRCEVDESAPVRPRSPYARSKWRAEQMLWKVAGASDLRGIILRYFNPFGSTPDLSVGFHERDPSHVTGLMAMAALGRRTDFVITGTTYPTRDGTGLRDYFGVWDLARAHVLAVERLDEILAVESTPMCLINLGAGSGVTVRELVELFERESGKRIPVRESQPRPGDTPGAYANVDRARRLLGWSPRAGLAEVVGGTLEWARRRERVLGYP